MKPQRIASLLASATEILYGLGLGEKVVAVSHECDFPPEVASKPRVTYTHIAANASSVEIDRQVTGKHRLSVFVSEYRMERLRDRARALKHNIDFFISQESFLAKAPSCGL